MLPKKNRVNKEKFEKTFKKGRFVNSSNVSLKFAIDPKTKLNISFTVPKSAVKSAVKRNLLKRRGYYVIKKHLKYLPLGFVGVFIFGKKSLEVFGGRKNKNQDPISNLELEIQSILKKI